MKEIARDNLKRFRKEMNISQEQIAEYLNLKQSSISKFESGERNLSMSNIEKVCSLFGIQTSDIFKEQSNSKKILPSFRNTDLSISSLKDIANINKIALNIIEMRLISEKQNG